MIFLPLSVHSTSTNLPEMGRMEEWICFLFMSEKSHHGENWGKLKAFLVFHYNFLI